jgi:hypothetical protein
MTFPTPGIEIVIGVLSCAVRVVVALWLGIVRAGSVMMAPVAAVILLSPLIYLLFVLASRG